jgi:sigma-B regulation protein RsbU (phosphoserine phosphatase)
MEDSRARREGWVASLVLIVLILFADGVEGEQTAYVGVLTSVPFLASALARPVDVMGIGLVALAAGQTYAATEGAGGDSAQMVRLVSIAIATVVAAAVAAVRSSRERHLAELTDVAEVAQATILRPVPATAGPLRLAGRYRSAASKARVGGDFYDVIETEHGVRLIVGDVRGKGLDAVRLAAAVLGSFREAAHSAGCQLSDVAAALERTTRREVGPEDFVTAVLVQVDPDGRCTTVSCGHPPLLRVAAGGAVEFVTGLRSSPPLGLASEPVVTTVQLEPGDRLLMYTDGVSEARDRAGAFFSPQEAAQVLASEPLDVAADRFLAAVRRHTGDRLEDDLAMLVLELPASGPATPLSVEDLDAV